MSRVVLIDIDGTLFNSNSTFDFLDSLPHGKWYGFYRKVGASIFGRIVNKLAIILFSKDIIRMIGINCLKGYSQKKLLTLGEEFYDNFLLQRKNSEVFNMLDEEKKNDSKIILASATLDFLSEIIKKRVMEHPVWKILNKEKYVEEFYPKLEEMYDFIQRLINITGNITEDGETIPTMLKFFNMWNEYNSETFWILSELVHKNKTQ